MESKKNLVEEAVIQMKNLEEVIAENAKGILQSTMKEEIKELVKESLTEEDEVDDVDAELEDISDDELDDMESDEADNLDVDNEDEFIDDEEEGEEPVIDLTGEENPEEVLRVFQLMGPDDEIVVKKDESGTINLKDHKNNTEYMIVGESEEEFDFESEDELYEFEDELYEFEDEDEEYDFSDENEDEDVEGIIRKVFQTNEEESYDMEDEDESDIVYEIEMEDEESEIEMDEEEEDESDIVYEIEMEDDEEEEEDESYDLDSVMESKSFKPKGLGLGKPNKKKIYSAKPNQEGGFKTVKKSANKTMGTGSAKKGFSYKDGENLDGKMKVVKGKKAETKEASRTLGNGSNFRKGGLPKPKAHSKFNTAIKENTNSSEIRVLREKNEEYRKALNVFRDKLNEVAVFNSNLAYATRLFTEHTTTKQEKINILKRFDSVETIKESKNLYHSIKDELTNTKTQPMNESIERSLNSNPSTGSAVNLIESKTYENPQFLRMKDLMAKLR